MTDDVAAGLSALLVQAAECHRRGDRFRLDEIIDEILRRFRSPLRLWIRRTMSVKIRKTLADDDNADRLFRGILMGATAQIPESGPHCDLDSMLWSSLCQSLANDVETSISPPISPDQKAHQD